MSTLVSQCAGCGSPHFGTHYSHCPFGPTPWVEPPKSADERIAAALERIATVLERDAYERRAK